MTKLRTTTHHAPLPVLRAAVFALVGTVLGVSAHHLVAEGPVPWRQSGPAAAVLFAVGLVGARRPRPTYHGGGGVRCRAGGAAPMALHGTSRRFGVHGRARAPEGWKFTAADDGYAVEGPVVKAGVNAEYSIVVKQLPDAKELAFKTLQTYSDGRTDRWIELDESGENPAPVLQLKAAAPGAKQISPSPTESESEIASPLPTPEETEPSASPAAEADEKDDNSGLSAGAWVGIGLAVVVVAGGAVYLVRRRAGTQE
jgi:hypothetical protein